jgi:ParB family transcriptional regulator, chromosome partitioning protein
MTEEAGRSEHRPRLGRGLAALLGNIKDDSEPAVNSLGVRKAPIEFLKPNPRNPRKRIDDLQLDELAASIRERGVIQPILVRAIPRVADTYEIIAGERRWRAAQRAGKHEIPIIVVEADEREALEIAIIENVQRTDLNALEEAAGYAQLGADYGYSHSDIARVVGKSRSHVANTLRLLNLPAHSQMLLSAGQISPGHARALLAVTQPDGIADRIVAEQLTVRDVERLGEKTAKKLRAKHPASHIDADTLALQDKLGTALGAKVTIRHTGDRGDIRIAFRNFEQLDDFCRRLTQPAARVGDL